MHLRQRVDAPGGLRHQRGDAMLRQEGKHPRPAVGNEHVEAVDDLVCRPLRLAEQPGDDEINPPALALRQQSVVAAVQRDVALADDLDLVVPAGQQQELPQ